MANNLRVDRRAVLAATLASFVPTRFADAQPEISQPAISESACPLEIINPVASDGYRGVGVLRKPPGNGPFPAIISLHGGMVTESLSYLQSLARDSANATRFLAAGYVVVVPTYRSRDVDPQSSVSLEDSLAALEYVRKLPYVDAESIVVFGCSGGGDLALEVAARTRIAAVVPEEPAIHLMAGMFNASISKRGERFVPADSFFMLDNPKQYYTTEFRKIFQAKVAKIQCPILLVQGDANRQALPVDRLMRDILIPELRAAGKTLTVGIYPEQLHCFCIESGLPWPAGRRASPPASWPTAALQAFRDIDAFNRRYLKTQPKAIDSRLVTYVAVRH